MKSKSTNGEAIR